MGAPAVLDPIEVLIDGRSSVPVGLSTVHCQWCPGHTDDEEERTIRAIRAVKWRRAWWVLGAFMVGGLTSCITVIALISTLYPWLTSASETGDALIGILGFAFVAGMLAVYALPVLRGARHNNRRGRS